MWKSGGHPVHTRLFAKPVFSGRAMAGCTQSTWAPRFAPGYFASSLRYVMEERGKKWNP